jgi:hypothetical protein
MLKPDLSLANYKVTATACTGLPEAALPRLNRDPGIIIPESHSIKERVEKWFLAPLREMSDHDGFIVLMVLFPLYEKHLRFKLKMTQDDHFSKSHPVFTVIGHDLRLSAVEAYQFWTNFRNGILHRALPKEKGGFTYAIDPNATLAVRKDENNTFWVNPFALRDTLLPNIEQSIRMWREDDVLLPDVYKVSQL